VADVAFDPQRESGLVSISAEHLFPLHTTWIGFARDRLLRGFMYDLMALVAPHLERDLVDRAARCATRAEVESLYASIELPRRP
jgi:LysR family transcriptional regulator, cys regulon transcriptional activator